MPFLLLLVHLFIFFGHASVLHAQTGKQYWIERMLATNEFMQQKMWNPALGNFIRRTDMRASAQKSDAWGITIVLDAYAYLVEIGYMKPDQMKEYYTSSTALYERTNGGSGARIIARQGDEIYIGGDDDLQWISALAHCYNATKDSLYLSSAIGAFNALIEQGMWSKHPPGWSWNSNDRRPNGVSTAYGALAAARLYAISNNIVYKEWAAVSLNALRDSQVAFNPRDQLVAANAAATVYDICNQQEFLRAAESLADRGMQEVEQVLSGKLAGERNPTDAADLAEGLIRVADVSHNLKYRNEAERLINFFMRKTSPTEIKTSGFYSRYDAQGNQVTDGNYLGVPLTAQYLPEVAEMLKLNAMMAKVEH